MIKAVLDTNIWISAIHFGGIPEQIIRSALEHQFRAVVSPFILHEVQNVLVKKFDYTVKESLFIQAKIRELCELVYPKQTVQVIPEHTADNRVLECVKASRADYLVTGDRKHLLPLGWYEEAKIVSAREFYGVLKEVSGD